ncbi:MAG: thioesterase family protein [Clostridia bacterium]|nr:thioesterase family protein [Clostridia bacterium]
MEFRTELITDIHDVDYNGVARMSSLMRYIQSAAQTQLTLNGMSYEQLKDMKRAFILSRIKIEFNEPVRAYERVCAVTYPCESRGYSFLRCYALEKDGKTIGRAVSVWALIDTETRSLVRVNDFELGLETHEPHSLELTRFSLPSGIREVGTYTVNYGDLDQNCHMNNTRYPDMYSNFLPLDGKRIRSISINYKNEAPRGERLRIERADGADGYTFYFRTLREDGQVNTEAEVILADI